MTGWANWKNCMDWIHVICADFKRSVFSLSFLLSVMGITALMFVAVSGVMDGARNSSYLANIVMTGSGMNSIILCVLPVFAFGMCYALEWEAGASRYFMIRMGTGKYVFSRVLNSAISGFLVVFVGMWLFSLLLLPQIPLFIAPVTSDGLYELYMEKGHVVVGMCLFIMHHSISGALAAVCSLWFSALLPNRFASAAAPFVLYFGLRRITNTLPMPEFLNPVYWSSAVYDTGTVWETIIIKAATTAALCILMGIFAKYHIDRRLLHA